MSKLIGTNPNQVPSNADLGSAAFMDAKEFLLARGSSLSAIDAIIPIGAVNAIVYDTSFDSDGGAWVNRCQNTSWYNERLNTTVRGSRREFPAVAVIVAESNTITIYDGDDPSLPMWMVFNGINNGTQIFATQETTCVAAINGIVQIGSYIYGCPQARFIEDNGDVYWSNSSRRYSAGNNIASRNDAINGVFNDTRGIINAYVNDIDMTVLPNAPINPATGLPVPTVVLGTQGGVSVIKDDGTIVSRAQTWSNGGGIYHVEFDGEGYWYGHGYYAETNGTYPGHAGIYSFSNLTSTATLNRNDGTDDGNLIIGTGGSPENSNWPNSYWGTDVDVWMPNALDANLGLFNSANGKYFSGRNGISVVESEGEMYSHITSNYNTGYMVGKNDSVKLSALSDADASDITSTELVTNGTFDSNVSGWTNYSGGSITWSSGTAIIQGSGSDFNGGVAQEITGLIPGETYVLSIDKISGYNLKVDLPGGTYKTSSGSGTFTYTWVADSSGNNTLLIQCNASTPGATITVDNISIRKGVEDRSAYSKGLQVVGTVKKTPVAAGADLVAYSGFTTDTSYLSQPYNSDLDFGNGDFCVMHWFNASSIATTQRMGGRADGATNNRFDIYLNGSSVVVYTADGGSATAVSYAGVPLNQWNFVAFVRSGNSHTLYLNGISVASTTGTVRDISSGDKRPWTIGAMSFNGGINYEPASTTAIALYRVTATTPSAEQIAKIYNDEEALFQENAKATLYGTSDAVTALAYDDSTNLLHAGTSAGRSVFQGLRRVDNTTRAVSTAISAIDGFVVEE